MILSFQEKICDLTAANANLLESKRNIDHELAVKSTKEMMYLNHKENMDKQIKVMEVEGTF